MRDKQRREAGECARGVGHGGGKGRKDGRGKKEMCGKKVEWERERRGSYFRAKRFNQSIPYRIAYPYVAGETQRSQLPGHGISSID